MTGIIVKSTLAFAPGTSVEIVEETNDCYIVKLLIGNGEKVLVPKNAVHVFFNTHDFCDSMVKWKSHVLVKPEYKKAVDCIINPCREPDWRLRNIIRNQDNLEKLSEAMVLNKWFKESKESELRIWGYPVKINKDTNSFSVGCTTLFIDAVMDLIEKGMTSITFHNDKVVNLEKLDQLRTYLKENR